MWALIHAATVTYYIDRLRPLFSLSDSAPLRSSTSYTENHTATAPTTRAPSSHLRPPPGAARRVEKDRQGTGPPKDAVGKAVPAPKTPHRCALQSLFDYGSPV